MKKGKFITFEGIDGSGKSSAMQGVKTYLEGLNIKTISLRQPGGSSLGDEIRNILKHHPSNIDNMCEVLLLCASFRTSYIEQIKPAIEAGIWVLCDRYTDSTIAYQCGGIQELQKMNGKTNLEITNEMIQTIINLSVPNKPDLTLYYDLNANTALSRVSKRGKLDNFEKRGAQFLEASRQKYQELASLNLNRHRFHTIDTETLNAEQALQESIKIIDKNLICIPQYIKQ